jgi:hypothetical protein
MKDVRTRICRAPWCEYRGRRSHPTSHPFLRLVNLQKFDDNLGLISSVDIPSFMEPKSCNFVSTVPDKICFVHRVDAKHSVFRDGTQLKSPLFCAH